MADTRTNRPQATFKHQRFADPEFGILIRKAAERQGMQLGQWVVETLEAAARSAVSGEAVPDATVPATAGSAPVDLAAIAREQQEQRDLMRRMERRSRIANYGRKR